MKRNHLLKYEELKSFKEPKDDDKLKLTLLPSSSKKYPPHDSHQQEITNDLVSFIAGDCSHFQLLRVQGFVILYTS